MRTNVNRNRSEWKPKEGEAEPNAIKREPKQNRVETKGVESMTECEPQRTKTEPNSNRS